MPITRTHVEWVGCSLHDLIQPSFSFLVGVALPFSIAGRLARGQSTAADDRCTPSGGRSCWSRWGSSSGRSGTTQTNYTFEDTLTQIGLGYGFLFLLGFRPARDQWIALAVILVGYWAAFALYPLPGAGLRLRARSACRPTGRTTSTGFAAHWNKNSNLAWAFDTWFLNLFPREKPFTLQRRRLRDAELHPDARHDDPGPDRRRRAARATGRRWAQGGLAASSRASSAWRPGWGLGELGHLPGRQADLDAELGALQRRLVLPAPGGLLRGASTCSACARWAFPLVVIGMNSIAAYCMADLFEGFIVENLYDPPRPRRRSRVLGPSLRAARSTARPCCWCSG